MTNGLYNWNPDKEKVNIAKHGIAFVKAAWFDWETALVAKDTRRDYGEPRFVALSKIGDRVHVMVFTPRGSQVWLISLRKANDREVNRYEQG